MNDGSHSNRMMAAADASPTVDGKGLVLPCCARARRRGDMVATEVGGPVPAASVAAEPHPLSVRQAAFIGVGAMVGAGIFSLLGAAGEVAGAAVWLSFLLAGIVAG